MTERPSVPDPTMLALVRVARAVESRRFLQTDFTKEMLDAVNDPLVQAALGKAPVEVRVCVDCGETKDANHFVTGSPGWLCQSCAQRRYDAS